MSREKFNLNNLELLEVSILDTKFNKSKFKFARLPIYTIMNQ